ncbi:hypothetical protein [Wohlfahrtiimonas populi]|uniref:hypothetical protein n=1 Tax=Wohlfahrtiimonas populi TaxID=1940240 RepID=UPI00098D07EC|nr:hypothetical protein [Wohlfahrtiimonas populi]
MQYIPNIANGHAFQKHVINGKEFEDLGIKTIDDFQRHINNIIENPSSIIKKLERDRVAFWDDASGTLIIFDPRSKDKGTAFRPKNGKSYFDNDIR